MARKFGVASLSKDPTAYADSKFVTVPAVDAPRAPTTLDINYPIQTIWRERNPNDLSDFCEWILVGFDSTGALWQLFACSTGGPLIDIETDDGAPNVVPNGSGTVQILGGAGVAVTGQGPGNTVTVALTGGGAAIDQIDVDFATVPGVDPVTPTAAGQVSVFGNAVANGTNANAPVATHTRALNQFHVDVQLGTALAPTPADPFDAGLLSMDSTYFSVDGNAFTRMAAPATDGQLLIGHTANGFPSQATLTEGANIDIINGAGSITIATNTPTPGTSNLGFAYDSGTGRFAITAADGSALSATNKGYVRIFSSQATDPGKLVTIEITANVSFLDAASVGSEIVGNLFGTTTGRAYSNDMPFWIQAVLNDAEDDVAFCLTRNSGGLTSPAAANIGAPDDPVADAQNDYWAFDNLDETLFDGNPALPIGCIYMQKDAGDDWTVQGLYASASGVNWPSEFIGQNYTENFIITAGHFGAEASSYFKLNGGANVPAWTTQTMRMQFIGPKTCQVWFHMTGDAGTDGNGAVAAQLALPYSARSLDLLSFVGGNGYCTCPGYTGLISYRLTPNSTTLALLKTNGTALVLNDFSNGARTLEGQIIFRTGG